MGHAAPSLWKDIRAAIAGEPQDFTEVPLPRAILLLAIPMVLEMCMESLFGVVDIFWVAKLGPSAVAAVGVTESMMTILYSIALGISMATTAMVARRIGEKNHDGASLSAVQCVVLGIVASVLITIPGVVFAPELLRWMGAETEVVSAGVPYARIIYGSSTSVMLLFLMNAIFRGAGDAAIAMRVLWISNTINIVLDPLMIYGIGPFPEMGIAGAAGATAIGRSVGVILQFAAFFGARGRIRIRREHLRLDFGILRRLSRLSATGMLQFLIAHASWIGLIRIIAVSGSSALAGYTVAIRIVIFSILPSWGLSNAAATLVGQNLGARRPERAEASVWRTGFYNMAFLLAIGLVFIAVPELLLRLFTQDVEVIRFGAACLRVISLGYPFYAFGMVLVQAFNGAGDTTTPTLINLACYWCLQIPLAWLLSVQFGWGAHGAFWAIPLAEGVLTAVGIWAFRKGRWKKQVV
jgi:putative MATE family efflux protein